MPTAAGVLECGNYPLLPAVIEDLRPPPLPRLEERTIALRLMDHHIRAQLLEVRPECMSFACRIALHDSGSHESNAKPLADQKSRNGGSQLVM